MAQKKILIIDDMPKAAAMVKARLEASGYGVTVACDAEQGLTLACSERPDLILLDIVMPAGGGFAVYARLKTSPETRTVPVIFLTAKDSPEDLSKAYKLGARYYLKKPYKPAVLLETVRQALEPAAQSLKPVRPLTHPEDQDRAEERLNQAADLRILGESLKNAADTVRRNLEGYDGWRLDLLSSLETADRNLQRVQSGQTTIQKEGTTVLAILQESLKVVLDDERTLFEEAIHSFARIDLRCQEKLRSLEEECKKNDRDEEKRSPSLVKP